MRRLKYIIITVIAILFAILIFSGKNGMSTKSAPPESSEKNARSPTSNKKITPRGVPGSRAELLALLKLDNARINFYGIVQDENGSPLANVGIKWSIVKSGSYAPSLGLATGARGTLQTTTDGRFKLENESGTLISIDSLSYPGYHNIDKSARSFGYGSNSDPHQPDESVPVRFVMTKDGSTKSLKTEIPLKFDWDGLPKKIELALPGGPESLILTPTRSVTKPGERGYDWNLKIQIEGAQISLGDANQTSIAPSDGYNSMLELSQTAGEQWGSSAEALIYARTSSSSFIQLRMSIDSDPRVNNTGWISLSFNPAGGIVFE